MNLEISKLADVPAALDLVKEEVAKAEEAIRAEGAKAMISGPLKAAEEAIAYAKQLRAFITEIEALGLKWEKLADKAESASPEAREIVRRAGVDDRKTPDPKTNFEVSFPDGTIVHEDKANLTLGRVIDIIGAEKVAGLTGSVHFRPNGEPLVTRRRSDLTKYPSNILKLKNGWFLNTQTDTDRKAETVKAISKALHLKLKVRIVPGTYSINPASTQTPLPLNDETFPYKIGKVIQAVFSVLQADPRMTLTTVKSLCRAESAKRFKTAGHPVLKPKTGDANETRDKFGYHRYYPGCLFRFFGKQYWLTSQFYPKSTKPVFDWLSQLGFSREEVLRICEKHYGKNNPAQTELPL